MSSSESDMLFWKMRLFWVGAVRGDLQLARGEEGGSADDADSAVFLLPPGRGSSDIVDVDCN